MHLDKGIRDVLDRVVEVNTHRPYHRLVLATGADSREASSVLASVAAQLDAPYINLSLEISRRLLQEPTRYRSVRAAGLADELLPEQAAAIVLDHIEALFEPSLDLRPVNVLRSLSRKRTVVAAWPGREDGDHLVYAEPGHPEYCRVEKEGLYVVKFSK